MITQLGVSYASDEEKQQKTRDVSCIKNITKPMEQNPS